MTSEKKWEGDAKETNIIFQKSLAPARFFPGKRIVEKKKC